MWLEIHFLRIKLKYGHYMQDTTNLTMLMRLQRPTLYPRPNRAGRLFFMGGARANALACPI
jgi:hypothetical protein